MLYFRELDSREEKKKKERKGRKEENERKRLQNTCRYCTYTIFYRSGHMYVQVHVHTKCYPSSSQEIKFGDGGMICIVRGSVYVQYIHTMKNWKKQKLYFIHGRSVCCV